MRKLFISILTFIIIILIVIKFIQIETLDIKPFKFNKVPYILFFSTAIALLVPLIFEKKLIFLSIFNFILTFIVCVVALSFLYKKEDFEKVDYFFSKRIHSYDYKKYNDQFNWTNERFTITGDTIFYVYPSDLNDNKKQKYIIRKSLFQTYYYVKKTD